MSQKKNKKNTNKRIFFLVWVLISALAALISMEYGKTVTDGKIDQNNSIKDFDYDASSKSDFAVFDEHIFYCTKDGMQYINSSGETLWNDTYNMITPYMVQNKGIIGVSEKSGRVLIIYNDEGKMYSIQTDSPIVSFFVNSKGFSSVITSSENEYRLEVYNDKGKKYFLGNFQILQGIPISSAISPDGNILAVGFLNINEINISSRVSFYDINQEKTKTGETSDSVFASFNIENSAVCGIVNFIDNDCAVVVSDKDLNIINVNPEGKEKYSKKAKIEFKNQIKQISFDYNFNIYIAFGDKLINSGKDALESGTVQCYGKNGDKKFEVQTKRKVTGIYPNEENNVIIGTDRKFQNYTSSGNFIWEHNTNQDTSKLLLINDELILFVGSKQASIIKLNELMTNDEPEYVSEITTEQISETTTAEQTTIAQTQQTSVENKVSEKQTEKPISKNNEKNQADNNDKDTKNNSSQNKSQSDDKKEVTQNNQKPAEETNQNKSEDSENSKGGQTDLIEPPKDDRNNSNQNENADSKNSNNKNTNSENSNEGSESANSENTNDKKADSVNSNQGSVGSENSNEGSGSANSKSSNEISQDDIVLPE